MPHFSSCVAFSVALGLLVKTPELIVGAGGPSYMSLVIVQHIKLSQITLLAHKDAVYLAGAIRFILKPEADSFRSSLLHCSIVSVLTDAVSTIGGSVGELKSLTRPCRLNDGLCALMGMVIGSTRSPPTRSTYYWPLESLKAGLLETQNFLTQILPVALVDCTGVTRLLPMHAPLAQAMHFARLHSSFLHQPWEILLKLVVQRAGVLSKYENAVSRRACDNGSCDVIRTKPLMGRRSYCESLWNCSVACQIKEWRPNAKHCEPRYADPLSSRKLSFIRALLHEDYLARRSEVLSRQISHMRHNPGKQLYTVFWYTDSKVGIDVQNVGEYPGHMILGGFSYKHTR
ncbi:hypothetical protein B0H19DRAFT_1276701 [Mycena capillaripes]|nr:hypothetical protein B0H19DRAFT_1276701 [Mycena capillaripes]